MLSGAIVANDLGGKMKDVEVTNEMLTAAMRAFEPLSSVLRYREVEKWHTCDMMAMREAIRAAFKVMQPPRQPSPHQGG
jgi:hypothetical protein